MDTTLRDPLIGQVLDGRYRVDARIAVGGMATVYRALDTRLDRVVALKVMHPSLAADAVFVERFIREAKAVARLDHPNVVGVHDQGADGAHVYLAMEYVAGCTLRDVLRDRGALRPRAALDVLEPTLAALGAAHRAGLVHRDVKPENVLIGDDGRVKVADFGLVRAVGNETSSGMTSIMGTVSYLAPEQIEHGQVDTRSDLYACGVLLHEMLTGDKPHTGETPAEVLYRHLHTPMPAPSAAVPGLAPELDALVARATAREPEARPGDAVALLAEVRATRAALGDAELDLAPPQEAGGGPRAVPVPAGGGDGRTARAPRSVAPEDDGAGDRTTVLSRVPAGGPGDDGVDRTSRLPTPPGGPSGEPPEGPAGGRRRRAPRRSLLVLLGVVLAALLGTAVWYVNSGQFTRTPAVLDMTEAEARKELAEAGLGVRVERDHSLKVERGRVVESDPAPGARIRDTGTVTLVVSRGPELVKVPELSGTPLADARRQLRDAGLDPGRVTRRFDAETAQGSVVRTEPAAGTERRPGSAVALTVSKGEKTEIPEVTGQDAEDAREELREAGLTVRLADERVFSEEEKGAVARQSPEAGATAARGDTVTLTLSRGPDLVAVPDVEGKGLDEARRLLEDQGFTVTVRRVFFGDTVFNQSPDAGDEAPRGSEVTLWVR
ncbi:Stk1 family PASTA domain-containing Ser/Thr kinase [Streptomyces sp. JJ36]|uniref:Stk1 family PASTA domain-containing Ser/Thr kinase n=1 Tax=Streptomyces sp. JJ36 TaxID=2736645 RepID=UPI001F0200A4|nr:Stk1 family PASTA domain-containing Ser/Thr kinase [Streptomyces sp. JJ36]MCF6523002.1 Stk1 family PASTA domain-containing Ser/Thr kinase [Streptomyces sp. JJ36]